MSTPFYDDAECALQYNLRYNSTYNFSKHEAGILAVVLYL
jgi:hypothetical protein